MEINQLDDAAAGDVGETTESNQLFVNHLPFGVSEQTIDELFRPFDGYVLCRLRSGRGKQLIGWVEFTSTVTASKAKEAIEQSDVLGTSNLAGMTVAYARERRKPKEPKPVVAGGDKRSNIGAGRVDDSTRAGGSESDSGMRRGSGGRQAIGAREQKPADGRPAHTNSKRPASGFSSHVAAAPSSFAASIVSMPRDATTTLYIEGAPSDATEREISHLFRRFGGYISTRLLTRTSFDEPHSSTRYVLCWVEFENAAQAWLALQMVQGYRVDPLNAPAAGLKISFSKRREAKQK